MTREEAVRVFDEKIAEIQSFINCAADPEKSYPSSIKFCEALDMAIAALREQDSNANQHVSNTPNALGGWISVEDRLPEPGKRVLATDGAFVGEMYINKRGQWQRYNVNDHALLMALDILWWIPLSEAPKEEV